MKIYFLIFLFVLFVILAVFIYLRYYFRFVLFKDMVYISKNIKNNIAFNKNKLSTIFDNCLSNVSFFTKHVINTQKDTKSFLIKQKDLNVVNEFIESMGNGDINYEVNNIAYYENIFEELKNTASELLNKDGKMYLKLIIGVGLAICIILI